MKMTRYWKGILIVLVLSVLLAAGWSYHAITTHPELARYNGFSLRPAAEKAGALRVTFLGVATLLIEDGETAILTDGFFTRPNPRQLFLGKIAPDKAIIAKSLRRAGVERLAAVIVNHSHYDHAMDSPEVAMQTGALLVGSDSTANIGRGWGMPEDRIRVTKPGDVLSFGRFRVTLLPARHVPSGFVGGEIKEPLVPPVHANAYLEGTSFCILVEHDGTSLLVNASSGFLEGALEGRHADVVFLGIGSLGHQTQAYMNAYWSNVVEPVGARRIVPIHWDNFALPLEAPLQPVPQMFDDFDASMRFLLDKGKASGIDVRLPQAWRAVDPFP